jgi:hypothetical protein
MWGQEKIYNIQETNALANLCQKTVEHKMSYMRGSQSATVDKTIRS